MRRARADPAGSERDPCFALGLWSNHGLLAAVALTVVVQLATSYVPVLRPIFETKPLSSGEPMACLVASAIAFAAAEAQKWLVRRRGLDGGAS